MKTLSGIVCLAVAVSALGQTGHTVKPSLAPTVIATPEPNPAPTAAIWTQEPATYRGIAFGANEQDVEQTMHARFQEAASAGGPGAVSALESFSLAWNFHCTDLPSLGLKIRFCQPRLGAVGTSDRFTFYEGQFVMVTSNFDADRYPQMRDIFVEKYGQPHNVQTATVQNKMGAQFAQETLRWGGSHIAIALEHYGPVRTGNIGNRSAREHR